MKKDRDNLSGAIKLRPVAADDHDLLLRIYGDARQDELARTAWSDEQKRMFLEHQLAAQTAHYLALYPGSTHEIILFENVPVGRLFVNRAAEEIAILDLTVLTEHRRQGIEKCIVDPLKEEAGKSKRSVRIYVEFYNPSTAFFEKLGFRPVEQDGINLKLVWTPE